MKVRLFTAANGQFMLEFDNDKIRIDPPGLGMTIQVMRARGETEIELELTDSDIYSAYMQKVCGVVHHVDIARIFE